MHSHTKLFRPLSSTHSRLHTCDPISPPQHISSFVDWLVSELRKPSHAPKAIACATSCLATLLHERGCRALFLRAGGVQVLPGLIKNSNTPSNSQLLYELSLCVWQMTYIQQAAEAMGVSGGRVRQCSCLHHNQLQGSSCRRMCWHTDALKSPVQRRQCSIDTYKPQKHIKSYHMLTAFMDC